MGHKTLIDGVGYDIIGGRCLDDGVGYSVQKGRTLVDGVGYDVTFGASGTPAGDLAVGTSVFANVNGARTEFLVVHQGLPSSIYDTSCDGTWLLMKDLYESRAWDNSKVNDYGNSTIHSYLNSTFLNLFDADIKAQIKSVKIPYVNGTANSAVASGANGLSAQIFLLSGYEVGWTNSNSTYLPVDGAKLDYFTAGTGTAANKKRIAKLNGSDTHWWLRSTYTRYNEYVWRVDNGGNQNWSRCDYSNGIRPAFILDSSAAIDPSTFDILG